VELPLRRPLFLFVVDTEGDDEWSCPRRMPSLHNLHALPRLQTLCERYGIRPTYVITYSVATDGGGMAMLREFDAAHRAEVGAHLHPWTTPPWSRLYDDAQTYLSELPISLLTAKLRLLTSTIAAQLGHAPTSFRAGRFGLDGRTVRLLEELNYEVDSSVTPLVSWRHSPGLPGGAGGPDFSGAPLTPYHPSLDDPARSGTSRLLEIPQSVILRGILPAPLLRRLRAWDEGPLLAGMLARARLARRLWLRPTLESIPAMLDTCAMLTTLRVPVFNCMVHSSELFPGASPYFPDQRAVDALFDRMDRSFDQIFRRWNPVPMTLTEAGQALRSREDSTIRRASEGDFAGPSLPPEPARGLHAWAQLRIRNTVARLSSRP
jgi:hypothetical protein